jgi:hypothetical protein
LNYLSLELEVVGVGLAESWRRGLRVVMRQQSRDHGKIALKRREAVRALP